MIKKERQTDIFYLLLTLLLSAAAEVVYGRNQKPGTPILIHQKGYIPDLNTLNIFHCLPRCINRRLDHKWSSKDSTKH